MSGEKFILHKKQIEAIELTREHRRVKFVGGIRSGKSTTGAMFAKIMIAERPNEIGAIFAPTHDTLAQMTLAEFKKVLADSGWYQDEHYVVGKRPRPYFGYDGRFPENHHGIWSFANGAQVKTFSIEAFYRGAEFGWAWGDEIQKMVKDDLDTVLGRMSGSKLGARTLYTYTPPEENPEIDEITWGPKALPGPFGTTYDNQDFLGPGYIEDLKEGMAPLTFEREVLCLRRTVSGLNWLYTFNGAKHISDRALYKENEIVYISIDFNINPFCALLAHRGYEPGQKHGYIHYFDEIALHPDEIGGRTYMAAMADALHDKIPQQFKHKLYMVTGDASGRSSHVHARVGHNLWTSLMAELGVGWSQVRVGASNPDLKDSRELCNAIFANHSEVLINPKCTGLITDCEFVKAGPNGTIEKKDRSNRLQQADRLDCMRYDLNQFSGDFIRRG